MRLRWVIAVVLLWCSLPSDATMYLARLASQPERKVLVQLPSGNVSTLAPGWIQVWGIERNKNFSITWIEIGISGRAEGLWDEMQSLDPHLVWGELEHMGYLLPCGYFRSAGSESLLVRLITFPAHPSDVIPQLVLYDISGYQLLPLVEDGGWMSTVVRGEVSVRDDWGSLADVRRMDELVEIMGPSTEPFAQGEPTEEWMPIRTSTKERLWMRSKGGEKATQPIRKVRVPQSITLMYPSRNLTSGSEPEGHGALILIIKGKRYSSDGFRVLAEAIATSDADGALVIISNISPRLRLKDKTLQGEVKLLSANQCGSVGSFQVALDFPSIQERSQPVLRVTAPQSELDLELGLAGDFEQAGFRSKGRIPFYSTPGGAVEGRLEENEVVADLGRSGNSLKKEMEEYKSNNDGNADSFVLEHYEEVMGWRQVQRRDGERVWVRLQKDGRELFVYAEVPQEFELIE